ncbi:hypothetical protein TIFTF001_003714 [Ficus carica]|uniref:RING-type domain-containing protein n=1 Tax=Ficus carica TaxID=3494 RepID=A0AA87ZG58_FICCA|nr:hypothetical protein TIFTF001_003714 [Ficus carica]
MADHYGLLQYDILDVHYDSENGNLHNLVDTMARERSVCIKARNIGSESDPNLSSTRFHLAFFVIHRTRSETDATSSEQALIHSSYLSIHYPFERFATSDEAKAVVARMLVSDPQFPLYVIDRESGQSLLWKEIPADGDGSSSSAVEPVPLERLDDVVTRISEAAVRTARQAYESGCNVAHMFIKFDKRTIIPHHEFERLFLYDDDDDDDDEDDDISVDDEEDDEDDDNDEPELNRAIEQSLEESVMAFGSVPAAKSVVGALEKFKYEGSCEDHEGESKLIETCVICMEDVMIGSHLTRMPCSHVFHENCIS